MKTVLVFVLIAYSSLYNISAQTFVRFHENGLINNSNAFGPMLSPVSKGTEDTILKVVTDLKIEKRHIDGYCEARADFIANKVSALYPGWNYLIGKIWAFAPSIYSLISNKKLSTQNPLFKGDTIHWDYHVAPILAIFNGNKIDTVVIDFSFKDNAFIEYHDWLKMLNCPELIYTFTNYRYYLFYTLNGLALTGRKFPQLYRPPHDTIPIDTLPSNLPKIITGHYYYLTIGDTITVPSGLAYNELACHLIDKYYNDPKFDSYKDIIKINTKLPKMKDLIKGKCKNLPNEIMSDCVSYYKNRLKYWQVQYKVEK